MEEEEEEEDMGEEGGKVCASTCATTSSLYELSYHVVCRENSLRLLFTFEECEFLSPAIIGIL